MCVYIYIYICMYVCMYVYIYIYIYMADSLDQPQLKTQKCTKFACELKKTYPINRKKHRGYMKTTYPTLRQESILCFLGPLRGMLRGYASGSLEG